MMSRNKGDNHTYDSGYSSSSTKKEKPSGLLGSLKELFSKKGQRKGIIQSSSNTSDIADNYKNFKSNTKNTSEESPFDLSPNAFFNNQGVKRTSDLFKPTKPISPAPQEFEIPVASGPARKSIVGLFNDSAPATTVTSTPPPTDNTVTTDFQQTASPHVFDTPKALSSVSSQSTLKPQEHGTPRALSRKSSASSIQSGAHSNIPVIKISNEEDQENTSMAVADDVPVPVIKALSPQDSDLSIRSEDVNMQSRNIMEKSSRAINRRGSLSNSVVSDISANSFSERSEGRRNRRRSGPKLIGPQAKKQDDETYISGEHLAVSHILPAIPPPVHIDPQYMPYHPYMLPPEMMTQYAVLGQQQMQQPNGKQPQHGRRPHPLHDPKYLQSQPPLPMMPMYPHPDMYGGGYPLEGMPPAPVSLPPPVMFPPVLEEVVEGGTEQHHHPAPPRHQLQPLQPRRNKKSKPVQRSKTMDPAVQRPKIESRRKKDDSSQDDQDVGVKGFDDFALY